jgi:hypothetical protein
LSHLSGCAQRLQRPERPVNARPIAVVGRNRPHHRWQPSHGLNINNIEVVHERAQLAAPQVMDRLNHVTVADVFGRRIAVMAASGDS